MRDFPEKVSIVMPTFNGIGTIELALDSIFRKTRDHDFEVIVVDDGSTDGTPRFIADYMSSRSVTNLRYTRLRRNFGICTALNVGFGMAGGNDVVRIDNDVEILTDDWLQLFVDTAYSEGNTGIVHCCPVLDDGSIHVFEIKTISADSCDPSPGMPHDPAVHNRIVEVEAAWLMCAYIKRDVVRQCINDEAYNPVWVEDIDYCLQARHAGFRVMCNQNVKVRHHRAIRNRQEMFERCNNENTYERNRSYFQEKWWKLRVPVEVEDRHPGARCAPDFRRIAQVFGDCPEIVKFLPDGFRPGTAAAIAGQAMSRPIRSDTIRAQRGARDIGPR